MVLIDFDSERLLAERKGRIRSVFREVPVRIRIAEVDLLSPEGEWEQGTHHMTITDVARWGLLALRRAREVGEYAYVFDEESDALLFRMVGKDILVHSTYNEKTVRVSYEKLERAWKEFEDRVRVFILREFPSLKEDPPGWGEWLEGQEDPLWERLEDPMWRPYFIRDQHGLEHVDAVEA